MSEEQRAGVAVGEVICEDRDTNRGGVRKRALLARRYRRRPSDESEHKLRSEDVLAVSSSWVLKNFPHKILIFAYLKQFTAESFDFGNNFFETTFLWRTGELARALLLYALKQLYQQRKTRAS